MTTRPSPAIDFTGELFRTAFDGAPIGMCLVAPDGRLLKVNASLCQMMGYPAAELETLKVADITHPNDRAANLRLLQRLVSGDLDRYELHKTNLRKDGSPVQVQVNVAAVRDEAGELLYIVAQLQDLTERIAAEQALRESEEAHRKVLERQARLDSLTGLPNRRELLDRLSHLLSAVAAGDNAVAVLFCDLDQFKAVNDTLGHAVGDALLQAVADRLRAVGRKDERICRFGGDEFVVLLEGLREVDDAQSAATRYASVFEKPFEAAGRQFTVTASLGVAYVEPGTFLDGHAVLRNADIAMYRAKANGRNRVVVFSEGLRRELLEQLQLERELHAAIERREFILHYQPILDLHDGRMLDVEALVRWQHPTRGLLGPGVFLPVIERAGLAVALGDQVLQRGIEAAARWPREGIDVGVAINLSAQQYDASLPPRVERLLRETGIAPDRVCLELTESAVLQSGQDPHATTMALRALGVRLSIDDFGTGYSAFAYLRDLPVHQVKLDRSFIHRLGSDDRTERVVAGMIHLAHELGLRVIAEGIETERQLETLSWLGCDEAQGFLFARPSATPFQAGLEFALRKTG